jgi:phosphoribosylanthranilate isomerase
MYASDSETWTTQITELITVPQLLLDIKPAGTNVTISWPLVTGFRLQSATNLAGSVNWSNVAQSPVTNNGRLVVTAAATPRQQFFRLQKQ